MKASRGAWIRAACSATAIIVVAAGAGAGCQPQLEIVLVRAADLEGRPTFVKFQVGQRGQEGVAEFGPFDVDAIPDEQFAPVTPGTEFFIDVIGCPDGDAANCRDAANFTARGCTPFMTLGRDEVTTVTIEVHNAPAGDVLCPPS